METFKENWEQPYILFYKKYLPEGFNEEERRTIYKNAELHENCPQSSIFPEMKELILQWKKDGNFLAVVSSDFAESLHAEVRQWGLENCFQEIATDIEDKFESVQRIMEKNSLSPGETFFVGDSNHEIDVAKKAGIRSIAVTWGFTSEQKLKAREPDFIAHTVHELENLVSQ